MSRRSPIASFGRLSRMVRRNHGGGVCALPPEEKSARAAPQGDTRASLSDSHCPEYQELAMIIAKEPTMSLIVTSEPISLNSDSDGVVHIGRTRVTLNTVVYAFCEGATAEEIVQQYPSLELADVYSVIGYYLKRQTEV